MKGMPYLRTADSMIRHIYQWLAGDTEEDHLAAVCFGAMCLMTYEEEVGMDLKLDDRCLALKEILPSILTTPPKGATLKLDEKESLGKVASSHESVDAFVADQKQQLLYRCKCGCLTVNYNGVCVACQTYKVPRQ